MKLFLIVALCIAATMALPLDETREIPEDEVQLTVVELDPTFDDTQDDEARVKRQYGGNLKLT